MLRKSAPWVLLVLVVGTGLVIASRGSSTPSATQREAHIESEVRCPQCEGQSALASDAPAARAVRTFVAAQVAAGQGDGQIERALQDRYGSDILLRPPASGIAGLVWVLPVVAFALAAALLFVAFRRWRPTGPSVSDADRALVADALEER